MLESVFFIIKNAVRKPDEIKNMYFLKLSMYIFIVFIHTNNIKSLLILPEVVNLIIIRLSSRKLPLSTSLILPVKHL